MAFSPTTTLATDAQLQGQPQTGLESESRSGIQAPAPFQVTAANEQRFVLPNGLKVYLIDDKRFPMVCTRLYVGTGSANETADQYGISHVLEHMVFKGTTTRPKGQIARDVESLGGYLNAATSFDKTWYITDMPSRHWKTGLDIVRDMAFFPLLDAEELEREKPVIISELEGNEDEPTRRLFLKMQEAALAGTAYEHPIIGTRDSVRAVTREALLAYIDKWYQPANMQLVVAGDINPTEVAAYVEQSFAGFANKSVQQVPDPVDVERLSGKLLSGQPVPRVEVTRGAWNKVYMALSFAVPGLKDATSLNLDVLSYLLAGDGTSYFERKYSHDLQLVDSISVANMSLSRLGLFAVTAVLDADKVEPFFTALLEDLKGLDVRSFTREELDRALFNIEDGMDRSSETLRGLASWRATVEFELGGRQGEANLRETLRSVDFDQLAATAKRYLRPEGLTVRVLAPEKATLPDMAALANKLWPVPAVAADKAGQQAQQAREQLQLDNGVQLILLPDTTLPYVSVTMTALGGEALVGQGQEGLAELTSRALADGCGDLDRVAFEKKLAEKALSIGTSSARQSFAVKATGPSRYSADLFALVGLMLDKPRFEQAEIDREKKDINAARALRDDDSLGRLAAKLWPALFGDHPYGRDSLGTEQSLAALDRASVLAFWEKQRALPWVVAVAGTYDRANVIAWASSLPRATGQAPDVAAPTWSSNRTLTLHVPDKNKAHVLHVYPTVAQQDPDVPALMLLDAVLSGQSGILFSRMRDDNSIGYTVQSQNIFFPTTGLTFFYTGTTPDQVEQADAGFAAILQDLKTKDLPKELLEAGCNALEGRYVRSRQSLGARATEAAREVLLGLPTDFARRQIEATRTLEPKDIRAVVQKYFHDGYVAKALP